MGVVGMKSKRHGIAKANFRLHEAEMRSYHRENDALALRAMAFKIENRRVGAVWLVNQAAHHLGIERRGVNVLPREVKKAMVA